jgi:glutamate racemase
MNGSGQLEMVLDKNQIRRRPIGVFDSGIGGLTVVRELLRQLPSEEIVYFGDTARVPYGTKSEETVQKFALQDAQFLVEQKVKLIVVACNTVSANSLDLLCQRIDLPIEGVIKPGARAAVQATRNGRIGVVGTDSTIASRAYEKAIRALDGKIQIFARSCPLFVPLAEEGWVDDPVTAQVARKYLSPLDRCGVDTLVLGCTHYPLLKGVIQEVMGPKVSLIDSATATAESVKAILEGEGLSTDPTSIPSHHFYVTDMPRRFLEIGERFLQSSLANVVRVNSF